MMQVPSQVWVGSSAELAGKAITFLQAEFCHSNACGSCYICMQISNHQFYNILWLEPLTGQYKVDQVREVLARMSLSLGGNEKFYFIFQSAQCLNAASANTLLKSIEEPPPGYNFLFLTSRKELLLPTILSRSTIKNFSTKSEQNDNPLFRIFTDGMPVDPIQFYAILDRQKDLSDQDSKELFDQIYGYWLEQRKAALTDAEVTMVDSKVSCLNSMLNYLPMPGSSKLFWKNLYLQLLDA